MKSDGGPAFPTQFLDTEAGRQRADYLGGMTLRDWFAAHALVGLLPTAKVRCEEELPELYTVCSNMAYALADAMLKARES